MQSRTVGLNPSRLVLALSLTLAAAGVWAQDSKAEDHTAHHPADAASAPKSAPKPAAAKPAVKPAPKAAPAKAPPATTDKLGMEKMDPMDAQMKAMQDMHQKFMAAKTPEERMALMPEHMKAMQDGMTMMEDMRANMGSKGGMGMMGDKKSGMGMMGGAEGASMMDKMPMDMMAKHQMMEKRMDMMQSMMQMMMDRMQMPATN